MVKGNFKLKMDLHMMEPGKMTCNTDLGEKLGLKVLHMKVCMSIAPNKEKVNTSGPMALSTMECGNKIKSTDLESTTGTMTGTITENGTKTICKDTVNSFIPMVIHIKVSTILTKNTVMDPTAGLTVEGTTASGKMVNSTASGNTQVRLATQPGSDSGRMAKEQRTSMRKILRTSRPATTYRS